jgi:spore photoproduct lyase
MDVFKPARVFFEPQALQYPLGDQLHRKFQELGIEIRITGSHNRVTGIPGESYQDKYQEAKRTLVVGIRKGGDFQTSKPSADYQLPLVTGCPGHCQYCYLNTNLGLRNYIRIYVNIDEILARAAQYIAAGEGRIVSFDGSCTSDPLPVEPWTGALSRTISFFAEQPHGYFRLVTKFANVDGLLSIPHNNRTRIRFSINTEYVISQFERAVGSLRRRIEAATKVARASYPMGFIIGPIMLYDRWQDEYQALLTKLDEQLKPTPADLTFELITHRFTAKAKTVISQAYPDNTLPMDESNRQFRWGQFGYGKYVYPKEAMSELRSFLTDEISQRFPQAHIDYFV